MHPSARQRCLRLVLLITGLGLWSGQPCLSAESFTLENVAVELDGTTYRMPRVEVTGSSLPQSEFAGLFTTASSASLASRLERLSATAISIPELTVEQRLGPRLQVTTYRSVLAEDVRDGSVRRASAAGGTIAVTGSAPAPQNGRFGRLAIDTVNLPQAARVAGERGGPETEKKLVYGAFSMENLNLDAADGSGFGVMRLTGSDARARPTRVPMNEAMSALGALQPGAEVKPEERARLFGLFAELLDASSLGALDAAEITVRLPRGNETGEIRIARAAYAAPPGPGGRPSLRFERMNVTGPAVSVRLDELSFSDFSFVSTLEGLRALSAKVSDPLSPADLRQLVPTIGTIRLKGLAVEGGDPKAGPVDGSRVTFGIRDAEFSAGPPVGGIPSTLRLGFSGLTLPVPSDSKQDGLKALRDMGYASVDVSSLVSASWNEPANELLIRELSVSGKDMGRASLRGVLGSITREAFSTDTAVALVALLGATAKSAEVAVVNEGLAERILAQEAAKRGKSADELRRDLGVTAAGGIPPMLGNGPAAKAIGQALARFVAKPGRLFVSARAKEPDGLGIADVTGAADPGLVFDRLDVTATAE